MIENNNKVNTQNNNREVKISQAARIVWFLVGIIVAFLLIRIVLALLGANLDNQFANFIYTVTDPFVAGFRGLLQVGQFEAGISRLELETIVAVLVYVLIGWGIASAVRLFSKREE